MKIKNLFLVALVASFASAPLARAESNLVSFVTINEESSNKAVVVVSALRELDTAYKKGRATGFHKNEIAQAKAELSKKVQDFLEQQNLEELERSAPSETPRVVLASLRIRTGVDSSQITAEKLGEFYAFKLKEILNRYEDAKEFIAAYDKYQASLDDLRSMLKADIDNKTAYLKVQTDTEAAMRNLNDDIQSVSANLAGLNEEETIIWMTYVMALSPSFMNEASTLKISDLANEDLVQNQAELLVAAGMRLKVHTLTDAFSVYSELKSTGLEHFGL